MTASPRSPSPSQAPSGTVRASSASGIEKIDRRWRLGHEGSIRQTGPLRDLYEGLYGARARPGVQLSGCAIRCCLTWLPIVALKARCHSKILTALAGMNYTRKKWCSWSAFMIPMHERTNELHRPQQSSLLQREPSYAE